ADLAIDVNQRSLAELRRDSLCAGAPHDHAVPLGAALTLSVLRPHLVCGDPEPGQYSPGLGVEQLRISPEVADQNDLVDHRYPSSAARARVPWVCPGAVRALPGHSPCSATTEQPPATRSNR